MKNITHFHKAFSVFILISIFALYNVPSKAQVTWQQTNGPAGGYTPYLAAGLDMMLFALIVNTNPEINSIYVLTRTMDGGVSWQFPQPVDNLNTIVGIDKLGNIYVDAGNMLLRSADSGDTWSTVYTSLMGSARLLPATDSVIYIYGNDLVRSVDAGVTWTKIDSTLSNQRMTVNSSGSLFREAYEAIWKSDDMGITWSVFADIASYLTDNPTVITVNAMDELIVGSLGQGLIKISADGATTQMVAPEINGTSYLTNTTSGVMFARTHGDTLWVSHNNGDQWQLSEQGLVSSMLSTVSSDETGSVYLGTSEGIFKSDNNGLNWYPANGNLRNSTMQGVIYGYNNVILSHSYERIFRSDDDGSTWQQIYGLPNNRIVMEIKNIDSTWFMITYNTDWNSCSYCNDLQMSTDGGITWNTLIEGTVIFDVTKHTDGDLIALTTDGMMLSTDSGLNWIIQNTGQPNFNAIAVDESGTLYAGNYNGVLKSDDKGLTWQQVAPMPEDDIDSFLEIHIDHQGTLYTRSEYYLGGTITNYLHRLIDESTGEWEDITPFGESSFMDLHVDKQDFLLAVTGYGLFRSTDNGNNWQLITESEDEVIIRAVTSNAEGRLFSSFNDAGVWVSDTYVGTEKLQITSSSLTVYPNPGTGTFHIRGKVPANSEYYIHNMQGRIIGKGIIRPNNTIQINDLSPGIYTISLGKDRIKVISY